MAAPARQSAAASPATNLVQARHRSQPNTIRATPATQNKGIRRQVPHLSRKTKGYVAKCHACHAKCRGITGDQSGPSAPPEPAYAISATPATQNEGIRRQVPRLSRKTKGYVAKCHACHAKCRGVTGDQSGPTRYQSQPNAKRHACHGKRR